MRNHNNFIKQLIIGIIVIFILSILINNLTVNLIRTDMGLSFKWLLQPSGFAVSESTVPFKPSDSYAWALFNGWLNSLKVIVCGLAIATLLGIIAGTSRFNSNLLVRFIARTYVALVRQIPLLIQLLFWYFVAFLSLSENPLKIINGILEISNQGVYLFGLNLSLEFSALLLGLSVFTGASISEVVRGGLNSVPKGQWEAFRSIGLSEGDGMRKIVLPQALPAILPGLTSQYLNLAKNSTLAIAIGYSDIYAISDTTITQTGRAIEGFIILLISFIIVNLIITNSMELITSFLVKDTGK